MGIKNIKNKNKQSVGCVSENKMSCTRNIHLQLLYNNV